MARRSCLRERQRRWFEDGKGSVDATATAQEITLTDDQKEQAEKDGKGDLVDIVAATMATEYHKTLNEAVKAQVESYGMKGEIFDSAEDPSKQLEGVEGFISKGATAIVVTGLGGEALGPLAKQAGQGRARRAGHRARARQTGRRDHLGGGQGHRRGRGHRRRGVRGGEVNGDTSVEVAITDYPSIESVVRGPT